MGFLFAQILVFTCGILAILFSVISWRLKSDVFFYLGAAFTLILVIYMGFNYEFLLDQINSGNMLFVLFNAAIVGIPIYFLIQSKLKSSNQSFDEASNSGPVTQEYLDEIINAPEEEINFEDDLNLK
ncbi:MAG: hypothetical protein H6582_04055 [Crocinitomicaceae bacterium]|nr:hypothetical protein [Crocinitomicaceae bacterium]